MELKYKHLFEELAINTICPPVSIKPIETFAFRWVLDPITNKLNFLPNYEFDKENNNLGIYAEGFFDNDKKCIRCSMSFFSSAEAAKINYQKLSKRIKEKLGYTHIATGKIINEDGLATETNNIGHFSFFEYINTDLKSSFALSDLLDR